MAFDIHSFNAQNIKKGLNYIKFHGIDGVMSKVRYKMSGPGLSYNGWYKEAHEPDEETLIRQRETLFEYAPKISILVSVYMTPEYFLRAMIESVQKQTYANFELCIVDGSQARIGRDVQSAEPSVYEHVYSLETEKTIRGYADGDSRIHYLLLDENMGISENTNQALAMATGEYVALLNHDDVLTEDALFSVVSALQEDTADVLYSDEDKMSEDGTKYSDPAFKSDFNLDLMRSYHYIGNFFVVRTSLAKRIGGFKKEFDTVRGYDFMLRCYEALAGEYFGLDAFRRRIYHIPRVLYHTRLHTRQTEERTQKQERANEAGKKALAEHLTRLGCYATVNHTDMRGVYRVTYDTPGNPLLSIIVSAGDDPKILEQCVMPFFERTRYSNFEIIIADAEADDAKLTYYRKLEMMRKNMRVVICRNGRSLSVRRNYGASFAKGEYLLFLDGNVEISDSTAISEMIGCVMRAEVGVAGGMQYGENGVTSNSGILLCRDGSFADAYQGVRKKEFGYRMHNRMKCDYSAVSASCMMVKKALFDKLAGFSTELADDISEIDFCLRVWERQYIVLCTADAAWCRHGRGAPHASKSTETQVLFERHPAFLENGDPYYNPNFAADKTPFSLG